MLQPLIGYRRGYVSFAHFLLYYSLLLLCPLILPFSLYSLLLLYPLFLLLLYPLILTSLYIPCCCYVLPFSLYSLLLLYLPVPLFLYSLLLLCLLIPLFIFLAPALSFLYPATKVWRGIMLYPSVSVRPSVRAHHFRSIT